MILIAVVVAIGYQRARRRGRGAGRVASAQRPGGPIVTPRAPQLGAVDLSAVILDLRDRLQRALPAQVRLRIDAGRDLPAARADQRQIELIIAHLVARAGAGLTDGDTLTVRTLTASAARPGSGDDDLDVAIEIETSRAVTGADPAVELIDPFPPGGAPRLELATVQELLYPNQGALRVEAMPGAGARIGVLLPPMPEVPRDARAFAAQPGETVLVVEDEEAVRMLVRRTLEGAGYSILEAPDPLIALEILEHADDIVDLLLSDIMMPSMRGTELVRRVRERWPLVRVLFMSGYGHDPQTMAEVGRDGAVLVAKPFTRQELLGAVRQALDALPVPLNPGP